MGKFDTERVKFLISQDVHDEIESGMNIIRGLIEKMKSDSRVSCPVSKLIVGLKCGGSDGLSGITANPTIGYFSDMLVGMDDCNVVAFSLKGSMQDVEQKMLLFEAIKYTVDHLKLKSIVVYSVSTNNDKVYELFAYAIKKGIKIIIPENSLKSRNGIKKLDGGEVNG